MRRTVVAHHLRRVPHRVGGDGDEADLLARRRLVQHRLDLGEPLGVERANVWAARVDEVEHGDLAAQVGERHGLAFGILEGELGRRLVDRLEVALPVGERALDLGQGVRRYGPGDARRQRKPEGAEFSALQCTTPGRQARHPAGVMPAGPRSIVERSPVLETSAGDPGGWATCRSSGAPFWAAQSCPSPGACTGPARTWRRRAPRRGGAGRCRPPRANSNSTRGRRQRRWHRAAGDHAARRDSSGRRTGGHGRAIDW